MDLVETFYNTVRAAIDEDGLYPAVGMVIRKDGVVEIASITDVLSIFEWFWNKVANEGATEVILGADFTAQKDQGTEFSDVIVCAHWAEGMDGKKWHAAFRIGVINYSYDLKIVREIDFTNTFWRDEMTKHLIRHRPLMRITVTKDKPAEPEASAEPAVPAVLTVPEVLDTKFDLEWLKKHAMFLCDRCVEDREESQCHPASDLKVYNGQTLCDTCYDNVSWSENMPEWDDLPELNPFACLEEP